MSLGQKGGEETISQELGIARIEAILWETQPTLQELITRPRTLHPVETATQRSKQANRTSQTLRWVNTPGNTATKQRRPSILLSGIGLRRSMRVLRQGSTMGMGGWDTPRGSLRGRRRARGWWVQEGSMAGNIELL
jgi:hypothetical protein